MSSYHATQRGHCTLLFLQYDKAGISAPTNPKFADEAETISLDDTKVTAVSWFCFTSRVSFLLLSDRGTRRYGSTNCHC